jgi:hypothetical protein
LPVSRAALADKKRKTKIKPTFLHPMVSLFHKPLSVFALNKQLIQQFSSKVTLTAHKKKVFFSFFFSWSSLNWVPFIRTVMTVFINYVISMDLRIILDFLFYALFSVCWIQNLVVTKEVDEG